MIDNSTRPNPLNRTSALLAAALFLVAISAIACDGLPLMDATRDHPDQAERSGPLDTDRPTVGNLDADLLDALQSAATDARTDGVKIKIRSGWRSRAHQQRLFTEAVAKYGTEEEASRWVSTPDTSAHVTGDAVDIRPTDAADWLNQHGAAYGLCQVFANEIWHFELATTPGGQCPDMLADSSYRD